MVGENSKPTKLREPASRLPLVAAVRTSSRNLGIKLMRRPVQYTEGSGYTTSPEQGFYALPAGGAAAVGQEHLPYPRQVVEVLEREQPRPDSRKQPWEVEGVRCEGHECPEAKDAVRVRPEEVGLVWVQVSGLDQSCGKIIGKVAVDEAAPQVSIAAFECKIVLIH